MADLTAESFYDYDLEYLGSNGHDKDVAKPIKHLLEDIEDAPVFTASLQVHVVPQPEVSVRLFGVAQQGLGLYLAYLCHYAPPDALSDLRDPNGFSSHRKSKAATSRSMPLSEKSHR